MWSCHKPWVIWKEICFERYSQQSYPVHENMCPSTCKSTKITVMYNAFVDLFWFDSWLFLFYTAEKSNTKLDLIWSNISWLTFRTSHIDFFKVFKCRISTKFPSSTKWNCNNIYIMPQTHCVQTSQPTNGLIIVDKLQTQGDL